jgi:hypothetical protein
MHFPTYREDDHVSIRSKFDPSPLQLTGLMA